ncbi:hypothetical protein DV515_00013471 [Chloebia gouldiae]|uniref:Phosphatidylethanolamine N-methyltransferase n=1 Tax=Chloebia gouldiae TaxID=44316 RepID=A0A3L8S0X9_CHLGU|nr:hypothetical protein DV515_00013471 [Chloebia gouldiae]
MFCACYVDVAAMVQLFGYVDVTDTGFIVAVLSIAFNPFFWNVLSLGGKTSFEKSAGLGGGICAQLDLRSG